MDISLLLLLTEQENGPNVIFNYLIVTREWTQMLFLLPDSNKRMNLMLLPLFESDKSTELMLLVLMVLVLLDSNKRMI